MEGHFYDFFALKKRPKDPFGPNAGRPPKRPIGPHHYFLYLTSGPKLPPFQI